jgi:hypothetical protein
MILHGIGRKVQRLEELNPQQRRAIERLIGSRLPPVGDLVVAPDLRVGDALAAFSVEEAPLLLPAEPGLQQVPAENRVDEPPDEPAEPELRLQDLWAATELSTAVEPAQHDVRRAASPSRRRKSGRSAKQLDPEYTPVQLFPFTSEEPPF